jgi:hypothetical protein
MGICFSCNQFQIPFFSYLCRMLWMFLSSIFEKLLDYPCAERACDVCMSSVFAVACPFTTRKYRLIILVC